MTAYTPFIVLFATAMEADPFITSVHARQIASEPYPVFQTRIAGQPAVILISGMGPEAAAAAVRTILLHYTTDMIFNCGVAGCLTGDFAVGEIVNITRAGVLESGAGANDIRLVPVRGQRLNGYPGGTLVTVAEPLFDPERRKALSRLAQLVDMEGGVIAGICRTRHIPCQLLKIISDDAGNREMLRENLPHMSEMLARTLTRDLDRS
ncbi:MAG: hypothetical protein A2W28_04945, partial [Gammaproteobacteria bacterium RBG_16_51_14]